MQVGSFVKVGKFANGTVEYHDDLEGSLISTADKIVDMIYLKYLKAKITYEHDRRVETYPFARNAIREAIYNAIAHKDYMGAPIQMRVWDDYVEVWNEGSLPKELTPEALLRHHSSHPRNKNIAYAFFKAGFIESWGRGYKKIREGFEKAGLPMPKIEDVEGGIRVTFLRNNVSNSGKTGLSEKLPDGLSEKLSNRLSNTTTRICMLIVSSIRGTGF